MKTCSKCTRVRPLSAFTKDASKKDGLSPQCRDCRSSQRKAEYAAAPAPYREKARRFRLANPAYNASYFKQWVSQPANRAAVIRRAADWNRANPAVRLHLIRRRQARKLQATPAWADMAKVRAFYESAGALNMLLGEWHHVDHIVPLNGRNVCGLHNEFNLQILPAADNFKKGNRFD